MPKAKLSPDSARNNLKMFRDILIYLFMAFMSTATFTMAVSTAVMISVTLMATALNVCVIYQTIAEQRLAGCVRIPGNSSEESDARIRQRHLGSAADASADKRIDSHTFQEAGQCAVAAAGGVLHSASCDFSILNIVHLEILTMSEMLKYLSVFVSYRYFHFLFVLPKHCCPLVLPGNHKVAAFYEQRFLVDQCIGQLVPGLIINICHRWSGYPHG